MIVYSNFQNSSCTVQYNDKRIKQNPYFLDCIHSDHWYMFVWEENAIVSTVYRYLFEFGHVIGRIFLQRTIQNYVQSVEKALTLLSKTFTKCLKGSNRQA